MKSRKALFLKTLLLVVLSMTALVSRVHAYKVCSEFTVYFDSGKESLNALAQRRLDTLVHLWGKWEILAELEGHTDSVNGLEYNRLLSAARVTSVRNYLEKHHAGKLTVREFARSEQKPIADNGTAEGKAQNRRVVIKYVVLQNGRLEVGGERGTTVTIPISAVGECGVCESEFEAHYFANDADVARAGIGMLTVNRDTLTTGGMVDFSCGCGRKQPPIQPYTACFKFPVKALEPEFGAWVLNRQGLWEPYQQYEVVRDSLVICVDSFPYRRRPNLDCPKISKCAFADSSGLRIVKSSLRQEVGKSVYVDYLPGKFYGGDTISKCFYRCLARDEQSNLWVCSEPVVKLRTEIVQPGRCFKLLESRVFKGHFKPIKLGDEIQQLKFPAKYHIAKVGYYIQEVDTTFQFTQIGKRKFESPVMQFPHTIRIESSDGKIYNRSPKTIKLKYNRRTKRKVCTLKQL